MMVARLLFAAGVPLDEKHADGHTPLMLAAVHGHAAMCDLLIKKKASLECADARGDSPLPRAALPRAAALHARQQPQRRARSKALRPVGR